MIDSCSAPSKGKNKNKFQNKRKFSSLQTVFELFRLIKGLFSPKNSSNYEFKCFSLKIFPILTKNYSGMDIKLSRKRALTGQQRKKQVQSGSSVETIGFNGLLLDYSC
jgi:hypothetical protein